MTTTMTQRQPVAGTTWAIDPSHSTVEFGVRHMMLATVKGRFAEFAGSVRFADEDFANAAIEVAIEAASIDTRTQQRDDHLRSADFFDAAGYPQLTYVSRRIEPLGDDEYRVVGDLTIRGVTREVALSAEYQGAGRDPFGNDRIGFHATAKIDRREFGLSWNQALETGGILVGDEVKLSIDVSLVRQP